jgi:hypothetical protein
MCGDPAGFVRAVGFRDLDGGPSVIRQEHMST